MPAILSNWPSVADDSEFQCPWYGTDACNQRANRIVVQIEWFQCPWYGTDACNKSTRAHILIECVFQCPWYGTDACNGAVLSSLLVSLEFQCPWYGTDACNLNLLRIVAVWYCFSVLDTEPMHAIFDLGSILVPCLVSVSLIRNRCLQ